MQNFPVQGPGLVPTNILTLTADRIQSKVRAADGSDGVNRDSELKKASKEFESIFISYLLKVMRDTIEESGLTEGGPGKDIYTELFDQEMSRSIADHGALGISDLIYKSLSARIQVRDQGGADKTDVKGSDTKSSSDSTPTPTGETEPADSDLEIPDFRLPVQAHVSSRFGVRSDPFTHKPRFHKGLDLAAPAGTEVRAAKGGEVIFAGVERGYGTTVVIEHAEGFRTRYAHLGAANVKAGDVVADEQLLGIVGNTGHSTGPHLHFEVIRNGERIDPLDTLTE